MSIRERLHDLIRAAMIGGFSLYIMHLTKEDKLIYYIAPRMEWIVKLSAVAMCAMAIYLLFNAVWPLKSVETDCGCSHAPKKSPVRNLIAYALFVSPLLLGWLTPDTIMGSNVVDVKGIVLSKSNNPVSESRSDPDSGSPSDLNSDAPYEQPIKPAEPASDDSANEEESRTDEEESASNSLDIDGWYVSQYSDFAEQLHRQHPIIVQEETYLETITAIDLYMDRFEGKTIEISGFVYKQDDMSDSQFVVARLGMDCCSADAMPYGFLVEWPDAATLPQDQWVSIKATISSTEYHGYQLVLLVAESVEFIETPESPYVYPNYDVLL